VARGAHLGQVEQIRPRAAAEGAPRAHLGQVEQIRPRAAAEGAPRAHLGQVGPRPGGDGAFEAPRPSDRPWGASRPASSGGAHLCCGGPSRQPRQAPARPSRRLCVGCIKSVDDRLLAGETMRAPLPLGPAMLVAHRNPAERAGSGSFDASEASAPPGAPATAAPRFERLRASQVQQMHQIPGRVTRTGSPGASEAPGSPQWCIALTKPGAKSVTSSGSGASDAPGSGLVGDGWLTPGGRGRPAVIEAHRRRRALSRDAPPGFARP